MKSFKEYHRSKSLALKFMKDAKKTNPILKAMELSSILKKKTASVKRSLFITSLRV